MAKRILWNRRDLLGFNRRNGEPLALGVITSLGKTRCSIAAQFVGCHRANWLSLGAG